MKYKGLVGVLVVFVLCLSGCSKPYNMAQTETGENAYGSTDATYSSAGYDSPYGTGGYGNHNARASVGDFYQDPSYGVNVVGGPTSEAKDRVIYFSYDSAQLDSRSIAVITEHARYLREHPDTRVVLEGHTDERGSREYNIGLGERRAYSVKRIFEQQGVAQTQMRVLSYGEERPALWCSNESCYARNRRVVIIY